MNTFKQKVEKWLDEHNKKSLICCEESCPCWDIANLIASEDEQSFQQSMQPTPRGRGRIAHSRVRKSKVVLPAKGG